MDTAVNYIDAITHHWQLIVIIICSFIAAYFSFIFIRAITNRRYLLGRNMVWLEITPPSRIAKTPEAT